MAQIIKIKRGLEAARVAGGAHTLGEMIYTTDNKEVFFSDGSTAGAVEIGYLNKRLGGTVANLTISGNLTVNGTTTSVNSTEVNIGDNIIVLNSGETAAPSLNAGFEIERGTGDNVSILWNETLNQWELTKDSDDTGTANTTTARILDSSDSASFQPIDADLTAIGALAGTSGILKKTAANTWELDTSAYSTTVGTVTSVTAGTGMTQTGTSTVNPTLNVIGGTGIIANANDIALDFSELTDKTAAIAGTDEVILQVAGVESRKAVSEIALSAFSNDSSWTSNLGTVTSVTASGSLSSTGGTTPAITHLTTDGNKHVPANSTTNSGKILTASGVAGTYTWETPSSSNISTTIATGTRTTTTYPVNLDGGGSYTFVAATTLLTGMMTAADKVALNAATTNVGTVTSVTAGAGMTQTGTSTVNPTLNVIGDASIVVTADLISVGIIDGGTF